MRRKTCTVSFCSYLNVSVEVLDVSRDASEKEIKMAFLQLAKKYHPDVNKEAKAEQVFADINEAYETLNN